MLRANSHTDSRCIETAEFQSTLAHPQFDQPPPAPDRFEREAGEYRSLGKRVPMKGMISKFDDEPHSTDGVQLLVVKGTAHCYRSENVNDAGRGDADGAKTGERTATPSRGIRECFLMRLRQ